MSNLNMENIEAVRAKVVSLILECPVDGNPPDCPLHSKRGLSFAEKFEWLKTLPDDLLKVIYNTHCECMKTKLYKSPRGRIIGSYPVSFLS